MTHPALRPRPAADDTPPSWRARVEALRYVPPLVAMVWRTHRGFTTAMALLRVARAFVPIGTLWVAKLIIDVVDAARHGAPDLGRLWRLVALEIAIVAAGEVLARASALVESLLGDLFSNRVSVRLMEHASTLDLAQFEDPAFYDHLERARRQTVGRIGLLAQLLGMAQDGVTLLTLSAALVAFTPWLLALLAVAILPSFLGETHFAALEYSLLYRWTPERRQLDYLRFVGASDRAAKEVQMFGLAAWLTERYRVLADRFYDENKRLSIRKGVVSTLLSFIGTLGYYAAYVVILLRAVAGAISIGSLTFLAASFMRGRDLIQRMLLTASDVYEQSLYLRDLFLFFEMRPTIASRPGAREVPRPIRQGFVFEDVGFRYPGSDRWAVRHVSLAIRPGERIALVGENGAGKTTLTKLLARLYDPTEGRILLDGVDLRDYDLAALRQAIGVIFQDFFRYDMRLDENIGVGEIEDVRDYLDGTAASTRGNGDSGPGTRDPKGRDSESRDAGRGTRDSRIPRAPSTSRAAAAAARGDGARGAPPENNDGAEQPSEQHRSTAGDIESRVPSPESRVATAAAGHLEPHPAIRQAADASLASSLLPRLPGGFRQMLGRRFDEGVDLSGGEWQKVALARAYMRDAQLLILDEPTAALDARAEYEVFLRFAELMAGRMAVLISHRFSTVRMADRIIVLRHGEVVEDGSHEELVRAGGLYAELFSMQAAGYR